MFLPLALASGESRPDNPVMRYREPAICIRATDYSETSQVVTFFTRGVGTARLLAKGTKRPRSKSGGAIDLLSEGDLVFTTSGREGLGTLIEFSETVSHTPLRREAARLHAALYMIELTGELMPEAAPHVEAFDLLHKGLARLDEPGSPTAAVLAYFQWRMLRHAGLLGALRACATCGASIKPASAREARRVWFSSREGGLLCPTCEGAAVEKIRLDAETLAGLEALQAAAAGRKVALPDPQAHAVNRLLAYHVREQLGKVLKLARYAIAQGR